MNLAARKALLFGIASLGKNNSRLCVPVSLSTLHAADS